MWLSRIDGIFVLCGCQGVTENLFDMVVKEWREIKFCLMYPSLMVVNV